jgi:hypothetical protein
MRKLVLVALTAISAMAAMAPSAFAQEEAINVFREGGANPGVQCGTGGNCNVHAVGSSSLTTHIFGGESVVSQCTDEFTASIGGGGNGTIGTIVNTGANCTRQECGHPTGSWTLRLAGETDVTANQDEGHQTVDFCLENLDGTGDNNCTLELHVSESANNHRYTYRTGSGTANDCSIPFGTIEVNGSWTSEAVAGTGEDNVELVHTTPDV